MKLKLNKKGFTLVELLVAISVLAIIMVIALPQISNIKDKNQTTKYRKYADSVLTSAKLYTDSYTEDMFGNNKSGCIDVSYTELRNKDLVKDIKIDGATCNNTGTYIRVRKANDHYFYERSIVCKDKTGKTVYTENLDPEGCNGGGPDTTGPQISVTPNSKNWTKGKDQTVTIKIWDSYGMLENVKIEYSWTKDGGSFGTTMTHDFKNKRYDGNSESNALTHTFKIPQNQSGIFVLTVKPIDVRDSVGNYQTTPYTTGQFKLDNTKPTVTGVNNKSNSNWTNQNVEITASSYDLHSGVKQMYYYYPSEDRLDDWDTGSTANNVKGTWKAERNKKVLIIAEDNVGNVSDPVSAGYVRIDKTAPTVGTVTNSKDNVWTNGTVYIEAEASDNSGGSGMSEIYYYYSNDATHRNDWDITKTPTKVKGSWSGERNNGVSIIVKDVAGNYSEAKSAGTIKIDKTAPVISSIDNPKNGVATTSGLKVTLKGAEAGSFQSGLAKWRYHYPGESWKDISNSGYSPYEDTFTALRENTVTTYSLCDVAGNCSADKTTNVFIVDQCDGRYVTYKNGTDCSEDCGPGTYNQLAYSGFTGVACSAHNKSSGGGACNLGDCLKEVNKDMAVGCDFYHITTCSMGVCNYDKKNGRAATGTVSESQAVETMSSSCAQSFCSSHMTSISGTVITYTVYHCTIKNFGVTDGYGCTNGTKGTNTFTVNHSGVKGTRANPAKCPMWVSTNEPYRISEGKVKYQGSWNTWDCGEGRYCSGTGYCANGGGNCVGT